MAARAERLKISTTEENRAIKALQEAAYIKGYMTAELRERERRKRARERKKRKKVFPYPKTLWRGNAYSYGGFSKAIRGGYNGGVYPGSNGNSSNYFQGNADCK